MAEKAQNLHHIVWRDFEEIVDIQHLSDYDIRGTVVLSIKSPYDGSKRIGKDWNLGTEEIKEMRITKIVREENPEHWL